MEKVLSDDLLVKLDFVKMLYFVVESRRAYVDDIFIFIFAFEKFKDKDNVKGEELIG